MSRNIFVFHLSKQVPGSYVSFATQSLMQTNSNKIMSNKIIVTVFVP
jgi:hypothetical protein